MHIAGVAFAYPERVVTNDEIIEMVTKASRDGFDGDFDMALRTINFYLNYMGAEERRWLEPGEQAFKYTQRAIEEALSQASLAKEDVDVLIYASVDKRVLEPGMAFFVAKAMGMNKTQCFDVTEACSSWTRATQVAQAFLDTGLYKNVLIVTSEYTNHESQLLYKNYKIDTLADVEWAFASYTIGEGSTATVLTQDQDRGKGKPWRYQNRTYAQWADLCVIPLYDNNPETMQLGDVSMAGKGPFKFVSYSKKMQDNALSELEDMVLNHPIPLNKVDIFLPHTNTLTTWRNSAKKLKLDIPYYFILPKFGNLVTNSMPAALAEAEKEGKLKRGDHVAAMMTAAGLSYTVYDFVY